MSAPKAAASPAFLFSKPPNECDAVSRRVVDTAESSQRSFLLITKRLTGHVAVQRRRYAPSQVALRRLVVLYATAWQLYTSQTVRKTVHNISLSQKRQNRFIQCESKK